MNKTRISTDGISVYVSSGVQVSLFPKIILVLCNILIYGFIAWAVFYNSEENDGKTVVGISLLVLLVFCTLTRYTFWNFFGKENIIVNTKVISYNYDYGFFQTKLKTVKINKLATGIENERIIDDVEYGKVVFIGYDSNGLPTNIFETTILLSKADLKEIDTMIRQIFLNEFFDASKFTGYNLN